MERARPFAGKRATTWCLVLFHAHRAAFSVNHGCCMHAIHNGRGAMRQMLAGLARKATTTWLAGANGGRAPSACHLPLTTTSRFATGASTLMQRGSACHLRGECPVATVSSPYAGGSVARSRCVRVGIGTLHPLMTSWRLRSISRRR